MFEELLERAVRSALGRSDPGEEQRFRDSDQPVEQKRWAAYLKAEISRRNHRIGEAQRWLNIAAALDPERASLVWRADMVRCEAELELAFDEPQRALERAYEAWSLHTAIVGEAVASDEQLSELRFEIDCLFRELCRIADTTDNVAVVYKLASWVNDRLLAQIASGARLVIRLASGLGDIELARNVASDTIGWAEGSPEAIISAIVSGKRPQEAQPDTTMADSARNLVDQTLSAVKSHLIADVTMGLGDAEDSCGNYEKALQLFEQAAQIARQYAGEKYWDDELRRLELNKTNQLAKLGRHEAARKAYESLLPQFQKAGSIKGAITCRFGIVGCNWRMGEHDRSLSEQIDVGSDLERMYINDPKDQWTRAMLMSAYRLLVNIIASTPDARSAHLKLLLRVLYALRTPGSVADLAASETEATLVSTELALDVFLARWSRVDRAVLLIWETGADDLVLTSIASGAQDLIDRVDVACVARSKATPLFDLIKATQEASDQLSTRSIGLKRSGQTRLEEKARAFWDLLPGSVKRMIAAAETIYYSPSNQSVVDELPFEALHDGEGFIGAEKVVCRVSSLRHMSEGLAPNRYRQTPTSTALLVEAKDPFGVEDKTTLRSQTELIHFSMKSLELEVERLVEPTTEEFLKKTELPGTLMHFVGHGFAGEGGEVLVLSESESVPIAQVPPAEGVRAAFAYFSACEVGRGRHMSSGAQRGLAATFLDAGSPGVVAPTYRIPTHFMGQIAAQFYHHCGTLPVGRALLETRKALNAQQYHPASWATLALFGDPLACITVASASAVPKLSKPWCSFVFEYLASKEKARQDACVEAVEADPHLDAEAKSAIVEWIRSAQIRARDYERLIQKVRQEDGEAAATLDILWTIQDVAGINTESSIEDQQGARERLSDCFKACLVLQDSYAAVCVIEALIEIGIPTEDVAAYRDLLGTAQGFLARLSADAQSLEPISTRFGSLKSRFDSFTVINLGNKFGYSNEELRKADQGDADALTAVGSAMMESQAHPEVLLGVIPWYVWMLRWAGTGTRTAGANALAALAIDVKVGRLTAESADALRRLLTELRFPLPLEPLIAREAILPFEEGSLEYCAIEVVLFKHDIETGTLQSVSEVEYALTVAKDLDESVGPTGVSAYFRMVLAEYYLATDVDQAVVLADEALEELARLQSTRDDFTSQLGNAVQLSIAIAEDRGDQEGVESLNEKYAGVLKMAGSEAQRLRDDHGDLAQYADDFRPKDVE
jgi:tetratricopeptide (TPR) repeat protein